MIRFVTPHSLPLSALSWLSTWCRVRQLPMSITCHNLCKNMLGYLASSSASASLAMRLSSRPLSPNSVTRFVSVSISDDAGLAEANKMQCCLQSKQSANHISNHSKQLRFEFELLPHRRERKSLSVCSYAYVELEIDNVSGLKSCTR